MKKIFGVYGTLRRGYGNNRCLGDAKFLGEFKTEPNYTLFDGGFPVCERGGNTSIHIELFETDNPEIISDVNSLEGCTGIKGHPANWYDVDYINSPYGIATIFVMNKGTSGRNKILETGKWN